jgi:hypothetical protein
MEGSIMMVTVTRHENDGTSWTEIEADDGAEFVMFHGDGSVTHGVAGEGEREADILEATSPEKALDWFITAVIERRRLPLERARIAARLKTAVATHQEKPTLGESFKAWLAENTPEGGRIVLEHDGFSEIKVCCAGTDPLFAYYCALSPGHAGRCFSNHKQVNFERKN